MRSMHQWVRSISLLVLAGVIALTAGLSPFAARDVAGQSLELFESEQFEYRFFYDPTVWVIEEEWSDQESDYVILSDGERFVYYLASAAPDVTPEGCLQDVLAEFATDPEILDVAPLTGEGEEPVIETEDGGAVTRLILSIDEAGDRYKLVTEERCLPLVPGESFLYISNNVPAEAYNELGGVDPFRNVPALALSVPDLKVLPGQTAVGRAEVTGPDGATLGILEGHVHCVADGPPQLLVLAEAVGAEEPFPVAADAFVLTAQNEAERPLPFGDWLYPEVEEAPSLTLDSGDLALVWLELPDTAEGTVLYAPDVSADTRIELGAIGADACAPPSAPFPPSIELE